MVRQRYFLYQPKLRQINEQKIKQRKLKQTSLKESKDHDNNN